MLKEKEKNQAWMKHDDRTMRFKGSISSSPTGEEEKPSSEGKFSSGLRIARKDLIYFIGQLGLMFDTGLNLITAMDCLAEQAKNPTYARLVKEIRRSISEGSPLWVAMKRHPKVFTPICVSMVRAGEASGSMGEMLCSLESCRERQNEIRTRVKSALSYPVFMIIVAVCVLTFLLTFVFPKFEAIFEGHEDALPFTTSFFLGLSHICRNYWYLLITAGVTLSVGGFWAWKQKSIKEKVDPLLLRIPLMGDLIVRMSLSRSFHTLALMLSGGIPTLEALRMAKDVAGNLVFIDTWQKVSKEVENGRDITGPLRTNPHIPPSEIQMISMGERTGKLPKVLGKLSIRYEKEIDFALKGLIGFIEPALVISMGFLVGMIVLSLILPIFAMSRTQA